MARIQGVSDADAGLVTKGVYRGAKARAKGLVPEPLRIMAHSKPVMWAAGLFELSIARGSSVSEELKSLAGIKVASMIGCVF
jgi:hypothetical protein